MRIFKDMFEATYKLDSYNRFIRYKSSKPISYLFLMPLFRILVIIAVALFFFFSRYNSIADYMKMIIPDFTLSEDGLDMKEKKDEVYGDNLYIYIDTDKTFDESKLSDDNMNSLLIYKDAMLIKNNFGDIRRIDFDEFDLSGNKTLTKDEFVDSIKSSVTNVFIFVLLVFAVFYYVVEVFLYAFTSTLLLLVVRAVAGINGKRLTDGQAFAISVYTKTTTFLLTTAVIIIQMYFFAYSFLIIGIPYFYAIKLIICLIYVYHIMRKIEAPEIKAKTFFNFGRREYIYEDESDAEVEEDVKEVPVQPDKITPSDSWSFGEKKEDSNE